MYRRHQDRRGFKSCLFTRQALNFCFPRETGGSFWVGTAPSLQKPAERLVPRALPYALFVFIFPSVFCLSGKHLLSFVAQFSPRLYERFLGVHKNLSLLTGIKTAFSTTCFQKFKNFSDIQNTSLFNPTDFCVLSGAPSKNPLTV